MPLLGLLLVYDFLSSPLPVYRRLPPCLIGCSNQDTWSDARRGHTEKGSDVPRRVPTLPLLPGYLGPCHLAPSGTLLPLAWANHMGM